MCCPDAAPVERARQHPPQRSREVIRSHQHQLPRRVAVQRDETRGDAGDMSPLLLAERAMIGVLTTPGRIAALAVKFSSACRRGVQAGQLDGARRTNVEEPRVRAVEDDRHEAAHMTSAGCGTGGFSSGSSVSVASVSSKTLATDTAFSSAIRTTLVGSMMPCL